MTGYVLQNYYGGEERKKIASQVTSENVQYSEENKQESDRENWVLVTKLTTTPLTIKETHQSTSGKGTTILHQFQSPEAAQSEFKQSQYLAQYNFAKGARNKQPKIPASALI